MSRYQTLKDNASEKRIIRFRIIIAMIMVVLLLGIIVAQFYALQITQYENYQTRSQSNRMHTQRIAPKRGLILDGEQRLLAENQPSYLLALVRDRINSLPDTLIELKRLNIVADEDIERFKKRANRYRLFEAVPILFNLTDEIIAKVASNRVRLEGVEVKANLIRHYPQNELVAHMLGYVGRINEKELLTLDPDNYGATNYIGKIGVEKSYEDILHGTVGYEYVETNAQGVVLRTLDRVDPIPGENIELHLNLDLQKVAYDALENSRGAVVALNAKTGGVLVAVSRPSYDPNLFVNGISFENYNALRDDIDIPLFNRILQAQYPPGSTIKPIIGLAGLEENIFTEKHTIKDPGWYQLPGDDRQYRDWKREGHGNKINFYTAMEQSCDVYYYELAHKLGINHINNYLDKFGIGKITHIDVPDERHGLNPTPEWKRNTGRSNWYTGDTLNLGIGQGYMLVTPLQLAYATSIIANRGERLVPQMVAKIGKNNVKPNRLPSLILKDNSHWDSVIESMEAVVHGARGTAQGIRRGGLTYRIAGKTGTAQVVGIKQGEKYDAKLVAERQRDHALFIAFAPTENPQIIIAVVVENGEHGSSIAAPIARKIMDVWMAKLAKQTELAKEKIDE